ncbi:MAG: hypothetical protein JO187_01080, partial [Acidobacteria bacterium]|nr:hypothetical protein [Acidobacteriota bacterium]
MRGTSSRALLFVVIIAILLGPILSTQLAVRAGAPKEERMGAQRAAGPVGQYVGPGGCAASSCHGSVRAKRDTDINQDEYSIWILKDRHATAYNVLSNPVSMRIGRILKIAKPSQEARCLACHSLDPPPALRAQSFDIDSGVSCENCHGPASGWLGPHTTKNWNHKQSVELGMVDMKGLIGRTDQCLTCHLGTQSKFVDHELIAAGHPDLTFELNSFSAVMPRHWKMDRAKEPWEASKAWSVGQAEQLRKEMQRLEWRTQAQAWPEYAELDCFACHHSLTKPEDSWRQEVGYTGRRAGNVPWNNSRYAVFRQVVAERSPADSQQLEEQLNSVYSHMSDLNPDRQKIAQSANQAAAIAGRLAQQYEGQQFDQASTARLMRSIADDSDHISRQGERSAEQAVMAIDSLYTELAANGAGGNTAEMRAAIN